jgi:hypothetical protein
MKNSLINCLQKISGEKIKPVEIHSHFVDIRGDESTKCEL